jgi:hypothetical protein
MSARTGKIEGASGSRSGEYMFAATSDDLIADVMRGSLDLMF